MKLSNALTPVLLLAAAACAAPGSGPRTGAEAATAIVERLEADDPEGARRIYDDFAASRRGDEVLLAEILYGVARTDFAEGEAREAADLLGLLARARPESVSVAEARVHALFLARAVDGPEPALLEELEAAIDALRVAAPNRPGWADLAATQVAIDRDRPVAARASFEAFERAWTGYPEELGPYVADVRRYLESHSGAGTR